MNRIVVVFSLISCFAGDLAAQPIQLSGPVEGFTFDAPSQSFRAILGFPGSAVFSGAGTETFTLGAVAPRKDHALAIKDGQYVVVSGLGSANPSISSLPGVADNPEGVVWSRDGSLAVFFSRSGNWIQTVAGLPAAGTPGALVDLSSLPGALTAVAADASGKQIAIGIAGELGGVYLIADGGAPSPLWTSVNPAALAFSEDGKQLYAVDGATLQVTTFQLSDYSAETFALDGLLDPVAIQSKRDAENRPLLLVAGRNDRLLRIYGVASHEILADIPLDFSPTDLVELGRNSLLLATRSGSSDPLWLFTTNPRNDVFFVPAPPAAPSGGTE